MRKFLLGCLVLVLALAALSAAAVLLMRGGSMALPLSGKVALVEVTGPIFKASETVDEIREYADDDSIKAIVLRVDSPGGAVAPSQEIYYEVKRAAAKKTVVVSMGTLAASGGYYISAPATKILAMPGTLTGSIGVIMEIPNLEGLMDKVGIKSQVIKSGKHKDMASTFKELTPEDREILQRVIDDVYGQFVADVAASRGIKEEVVRGLADGRIYTGRQALGLKLVDKLGSLKDAIALAAELEGIEGEPNVVRKPERTFVQELLQGKFLGNMDKVLPSLQLKYMLQY